MKKLLAFILSLFLFTVSAAVSASASPSPRLLDRADILTDGEEAVLLSRLNEISERQEFDVVIVTVSSLNGNSVTAMADDIYDTYGYGYGADDDGILFLVSMAEQQYATSTYGFGIQAFTDYGQDTILNKVLPYLSDGDYYRGFMEFASQCDAYIAQAYKGESYDVSNREFEFDYIWIVIALIIGVIAAFICTSLLKRQLNNVRKNDNASNYIKPNSMRISISNDMFLYRHVTRTARPKDTGGGSSTRHSSSGRSHGGRSGRF